MSLRIAERLDDISRAIAEVKALLAGRSRDFLIQDRVARAAFERFLEIISEASRHVPDELKAKHAAIPWQDIASLGNRLRHAYWLLGITWITGTGLLSNKAVITASERRVLERKLV